MKLKCKSAQDNESSASIIIKYLLWIAFFCILVFGVFTLLKRFGVL